MSVVKLGYKGRGKAGLWEMLAGKLTCVTQTPLRKQKREETPPIALKKASTVQREPEPEDELGYKAMRGAALNPPS